MNKLSTSAQENLQKWLTEPKYGEYKTELEKLVQAEQWQVLEDSFFKIVPFGTGGRRGTVGIGSNRINNVTIGESAQGMANYLVKQGEESAKQAGVVIGFDSRSTSVAFSQLTASIFAANGFKVYLFDSCRATPELSFAVRHLKAAAGVVISASHNPPPDNGFKAYWSDGGQIVPPHDKGIMDKVAAVTEIKKTDFQSAVAAGQIQIISKEVDKAYVQAVCNESLVQTRSARIVYSPLHGTGMFSVLPVLQKAGFPEVTLVSEQMTPDGTFPNIKNNIPNPEVLSASELVTKYAQEQEADIGITTDPDADRLGVVARTKDGQYQFLTGNQIAALLGFFVLDQLKQQHKLQPNDFIVKTIVTTDFLNTMADEFGVKIYDNLLIGFKYVAEMIREKEGREQFLFGGEESHGILKGTYARDKDAAIAALLMAELTSWLKDQGKTLPQFLDELYARYGLFWETLHTVAYPGAEGSANMKAIMAKLRATPPHTVGAEKVVGIVDRLTSDEGPKGDVVILLLSEDRKNRVTIRPSGTEPKLKLYIQLYIKEVNKEKMLQRADELAKNLQSWLLP